MLRPGKIVMCLSTDFVYIRKEYFADHSSDIYLKTRERGIRSTISPALKSKNFNLLVQNKLHQALDGRADIAMRGRKILVFQCREVGRKTKSV